MEFYFIRLKEVLKKIYNSTIFEDADELYDALLFEKSESNFNLKYDEFLSIFCMYIYNSNYSLQTLTKNTLPFEINKEEEFIVFFNKFKQYEGHLFESSIENDNYYRLLFRALNNRGKIYESDDWLQITREELESAEEKSLPSTHKIYLPIANESLHLFANKFLSLCKGRGIDYDFKKNHFIGK